MGWLTAFLHILGGGWTAFVLAIEHLVHSAGATLGGHPVAGIVATTLAIRLALIPILLPLAARTRDRQRIVDRMKPELAALKQEHRKDPDRLHKEIGALHTTNGISVVDGPGLLGSLIQIPLLIALFQAVYHLSKGTPLAAGGLLPGLLAAALSVVTVRQSPQAGSIPMLAVAAIVPVGMALWLGQGIAFYLIAFYAGSAVQGLLLRRRPATVPELADTLS